MVKRPDQPTAVEDLLRRLKSADAGPAWVEFLDGHAQQIMDTAGLIEFEQDRIDECFLYVCEKLNEDGFRRLLKFNTAGAATFRTWLGTVVFNLCVDWHRHEYGRVRLLPAISALPEFDQSVYHLVIEEGMDKESCFQKLSMEFPDLDRELVANALKRIHRVLTPRQRWQITAGNRRRKHEDPRQGEVELLADPESSPELEAQAHQDRGRLERAMSLLPSEQRLLLYWRYQEGLSLAKIAQLADLGNTNRTWRQIQAAVNALFEHIREMNPSENQKN